jgi:hypothetical protein
LVEFEIFVEVLLVEDGAVAFHVFSNPLLLLYAPEYLQIEFLLGVLLQIVLDVDKQ